MELLHYLIQLDVRQELDALDMRKLRQNKIKAIDGDGLTAYVWTVWRCLYGELSFGGEAYRPLRPAAVSTARQPLTRTVPVSRCQNVDRL